MTPEKASKLWRHAGNMLGQLGGYALPMTTWCPSTSSQCAAQTRWRNNIFMPPPMIPNSPPFPLKKGGACTATRRLSSGSGAVLGLSGLSDSGDCILSSDNVNSQGGLPFLSTAKLRRLPYISSSVHPIKREPLNQDHPKVLLKPPRAQGKTLVM